jgi:hypothetical protein
MGTHTRILIKQISYKGRITMMSKEIKELVCIANELDDRGLMSEADKLDEYLAQSIDSDQALLNLIEKYESGEVASDDEGPEAKFLDPVIWAVIASWAGPLVAWLGTEIWDSFVGFLKDRAIDKAMRYLAARIFERYVEDPDSRVWGEDSKLFKAVKSLRPNKEMLSKLNEEQKIAFVENVLEKIQSDYAKPFSINVDDIMIEMFPELFSEDAA